MGGSIRIPASMNGVYGFKPPFGRVPTSEIAYETLGPLTRTFDDLVLMQDIIAGPHPRNHATLRPKMDYQTEYQSLKGAKVAVCYFPKWLEGGCDKEINEALDKVVEALKKSGAEVKVINSDWTIQGGKLATFLNGLLSTEMYELIQLLFVGLLFIDILRKNCGRMKFLLPVRLSAQQAMRYYARPYTALNEPDAKTFSLRIRPSVEDVTEDRQREVTQFLRRGIVPQQRQRQEEKDE